MSTAEIKSEIDKTLSLLPQEALESVLIYLRSVAETTQSKITLSSNFRIILEEDAALLKKLAE